MNNNLPRERSRLTHLSHQLKVFYYENIYELTLRLISQFACFCYTTFLLPKCQKSRE